MQDQIPEPVIKKVEFGLLLYLACPNAPQNVIQVSSQNYCYSIVYMHFAVATMTFTCTGYYNVKKSIPVFVIVVVHVLHNFRENKVGWC